MNAFDRKPKKPLAVCPKCGMDSGERKCTVNLPERYFIRYRPAQRQHGTKKARRGGADDNE